MENGLLSTGRAQAAHGRPEQAHPDLRSGLPIRRGRAQHRFDAFAAGTNTSSTKSVKSLLPAARLYLLSKMSRLILASACVVSAWSALP